MRIFIKNLIGTIISFDINSTDTIYDIKYKIQEKDGILVEYQRLNFNGKQLYDERTLEDHNIQNDDTLYLYLRLIGGFIFI
jgi:ubiquitin C